MPPGSGRGGKRTERSSVATQNHAMRRLEGWAVDARHACQLVGGVVPPNSSAPCGSTGSRLPYWTGTQRDARLGFYGRETTENALHDIIEGTPLTDGTRLHARNLDAGHSVPHFRSGGTFERWLQRTAGGLVQPLAPARFARLGCRDAHSLRLPVSEPLGHTLQHVGTSSSP